MLLRPQNLSSSTLFDSNQRTISQHAAIAFVGLLGGYYLGEHDVEDSSCRSDCPLSYCISTRLRGDPSGGAPLSAADWGKLTDLRIDLVKAALKLTPEQEKYWPAVEDAIRTRAKNRQAR